MGFLEAIKSGFVNFAVFKGRSTRREYWWFVLFLALVSIAIRNIGAIIDVDLNGLVGLFWLITMIPYCALAVRRMHDVGQTGWMNFVIIIPFGFIVLFGYLITKSEADNKYGPNPLIGITLEEINSIGNNE